MLWVWGGAGGGGGDDGALASLRKRAREAQGVLVVAREVSTCRKVDVIGSGNRESEIAVFRSRWSLIMQAKH